MVPLHEGHGAVPLSVQLTVALLAGGGASLFLLAAVTRQSYGDVIPLLAVSLLTRSDLLEVPRWQVTAGTAGLGLALGVGARLVGVAAAGTAPAPVAGVDLLTVQDLLGAAAVVALLYLLGAFAVLPVADEDATDPGRIRRQWLLACLAYGGGFLAWVPVASLVVPGS